MAGFALALNLLYHLLHGQLGIARSLEHKISRTIIDVIIYELLYFVLAQLVYQTAVVCCIRYSAICTALVAAPFLKLSATIHIFKVLG